MPSAQEEIKEEGDHEEMTTHTGSDYSGLVTPEMRKAGLNAEDIQFSIQSAHLLNDAVKMRRAKLREDLSSLGSPEEQENRETRERIDDDRIFLGAVTLLAQRMKPKPKTK